MHRVPQLTQWPQSPTTYLLTKSSRLNNSKRQLQAASEQQGKRTPRPPHIDWPECWFASSQSEGTNEQPVQVIAGESHLSCYHLETKERGGREKTKQEGKQQTRPTLLRWSAFIDVKAKPVIPETKAHCSKITHSLAHSLVEVQWLPHYSPHSINMLFNLNVIKICSF